jgi:hypothetical protein
MDEITLMTCEYGWNEILTCFKHPFVEAHVIVHLFQNLTRMDLTLI